MMISFSPSWQNKSLFETQSSCGQQTLPQFQAFKNVFMSDSSASCDRRTLHPHPPFYRQMQKYAHHPSYRHWKNASPGWQPYWAWLLAEAPLAAYYLLLCLHSLFSGFSPKEKPFEPLWRREGRGCFVSKDFRFFLETGSLPGILWAGAGLFPLLGLVCTIFVCLARCGPQGQYMEGLGVLVPLQPCSRACHSPSTLEGKAWW